MIKMHNRPFLNPELKFMAARDSCLGNLFHNCRTNSYWTSISSYIWLHSITYAKYSSLTVPSVMLVCGGWEGEGEGGCTTKFFTRKNFYTIYSILPIKRSQEKMSQVSHSLMCDYEALMYWWYTRTPSCGSVTPVITQTELLLQWLFDMREAFTISFILATSTFEFILGVSLNSYCRLNLSTPV